MLLGLSRQGIGIDIEAAFDEPERAAALGPNVAMISCVEDEIGGRERDGSLDVAPTARTKY